MKRLMAKARGIRPGTRDHRATYGKSVGLKVKRAAKTVAPEPVESTGKTTPAGKTVRVEFARTVATKGMTVADLNALVRKRFGFGVNRIEASAILKAAGTERPYRRSGTDRSRARPVVNGGIVAAIQKLVAAVPGISSLTIAPDGSVEYTMREVVERKGRVRL
jgi:hypothetical protein